MWLYLAAVTMVATALLHSFLGEQRLIRPLLAINTPLLQSTLARQVLRYAWHFTSVLMILSAVVIVWSGVPSGVIIVVGITWLVTGIADAVLTSGRHLGWPFITIAGVFTLLAAWN